MFKSFVGKVEDLEAQRNELIEGKGDDIAKLQQQLLQLQSQNDELLTQSEGKLNFLHIPRGNISTFNSNVEKYFLLDTFAEYGQIIHQDSLENIL